MANLTKVKNFFEGPDMFTYMITLILAILMLIWFVQTAFLK